MNLPEAKELFIRVKKSERRKPATIKKYHESLDELCVIDKPVECITTDDLNEIYTDLSQRVCYASHPTRPASTKTVSASTLDRHVRTWRTFFTWLVTAGHIPISPARLVKRPRRPRQIPRGISVVDLLKLLLQAWQTGLLEYAIVCVLAGTACRLGGLVALTLDDIDLDALTITLHEKFDKTRQVRLPRRAAEALRRYIEEERPRDQGNSVFIGRRGPLTGSGIYLLLKRAAEKADVHRFNPHSFRHGFVSYALQHGTNAKALQEILGHEDVSTTLMIYGAMANRDVLDAHDRIKFLPDELDSLLTQIERSPEDEIGGNES